MQRRDAVLSDAVVMFRRSVALVFVEAILWILRMQRNHLPIPRDLGDDGRGTDAPLRVVSANDGTVRMVEPESVSAIDEKIKVRMVFRDLRDRLLHGALGGRENAELVDKSGIRHANTEDAVLRKPCI